MRVAHFDCFSGISGDMTLGAVIDAGVEAAAITAAVDSLGLPVKFHVEKVRKGGMAATRVIVDAPQEHAHRHLPQIESILANGRLSTRQRDLAVNIFRKLAAAEAKVHDTSVEKVHFHEVGALDSIADIAGAAVGLDLLGVERFTCRSVPPGSGTVKCAHGLMPVPAPATAELLKGVPLASSPVPGELTTPTGAAILATIVAEWTDSPSMTVERIGTGAGSRDLLEQPNVLRLLIGTTSETPTADDTVWVLETNLDDIPAEVIGYATERLFAAGALDVWATPVHMKKNRPGVVLSVIAGSANWRELESVLFRETGTFGVRRSQALRSKLYRDSIELVTPWGKVRGKRGERPGVPAFVTPEYDDCARLAREAGVPLRDVYRAARPAE